MIHRLPASAASLSDRSLPDYRPWLRRRSVPHSLSEKAVAPCMPPPNNLFFSAPLSPPSSSLPKRTSPEPHEFRVRNAWRETMRQTDRSGKKRWRRSDNETLSLVTVFHRKDEEIFTRDSFVLHPEPVCCIHRLRTLERKDRTDDTYYHAFDGVFPIRHGRTRTSHYLRNPFGRATCP